LIKYSKEQPKECLPTPFPRRNSFFYTHTIPYHTLHHHPPPPTTHLHFLRFSPPDGGTAATRRHHGPIYSYYCCHHHHNHHNHLHFPSSQGPLLEPYSSSCGKALFYPTLYFFISFLLFFLSFHPPFFLSFFRSFFRSGFLGVGWLVFFYFFLLPLFSKFVTFVV